MAGARGITPGEATTLDCTDAGAVDGTGDVVGYGDVLGNGAADVTVPDGSGAGVNAGASGGGGLRSGGGGGPERRVCGPLGRMPRADGGGGIRDVGAALPAGRGTMLTGLGGTLTGPGAGT